MKLDPEKLSPKSMLQRLKTRISETIKVMSCPVHMDRCHATIILDSDNSDFSWEIEQSCCSAFSHLLESAIPYPIYNAKNIRSTRWRDAQDEKAG